MSALEWNGRAITLGDFDILTGRTVRAAFKIDNETGTYACLAASARYVDTGAPVFASADEVWAQPFRLQARLLRLATEAAKVNGMLDADDAGDDGERITNGSGEGVGPSP